MRLLLIITFLFAILPTYIHGQDLQDKTIDILNYTFDLKINDKTDVIYGTATITFILLEPSNEFFVDLVRKKGKEGMTVTSVKFNGLPSCHFHDKDKLYIRKTKDYWNANVVSEIEIEYHGIPGDGLMISNNKFGTRSFFADNWPERAHHWLPVIDHPSEKAKVEFWITCPEHYEVIASGKWINTESIAGNRKKHHFKSEQELSSKVMVFAASDFKTTIYDTIAGIPVSSWIYEENKSGEWDYIYAVDALQFFSDTIGPYFYEKLANVQSKTKYGGMENAGNIFYFENSITGRADYEALVVHEVAHHWFGNAATEKNWHHIWLSEGFATCLTNLYWENKYGKDAFLKRLKNERKTVLNFSKSFPQAVVNTTITDWNLLLNPLSYQKGAWILHMLRHKTGDRDFYQILSSYYDNYKDSSALSSDFKDIAEAVSGKELDLFFDQWLFYPTNPLLEIKYFEENSIFHIQVEQIQDAKLFQLDLDLIYNEKLYPLKISDKRSYFTIDQDKEATKLALDPYVKLLAEIKIKKHKFEPKQSPAHLNNSPILIDSPNFTLLRKGDLLFQDLDCGPLCNAIESVTEGYKGADFSHVGIISEISGDTILVTEAIGAKVRETKLEDFLSRSRDKNGRPKVFAGRLRKDTLVKNAIPNLKKYLGKPYDAVFDISDDSYYCSELVYFAFSDNSEPIFNLYPMTFKSPQTGEFDPAWIDYYKELGVDIPEGEAGLNPGGISRSPYVTILYKFGDPSGYFESSYK